ncbi:MAG: efflux RND transporter periplasmic adaptor subunit [Bacteroidetes bacterium]|nr:MAG: efflux RND transporter periplasmic adaptor subunit [Bacteroidota bacterium]
MNRVIALISGCVLLLSSSCHTEKVEDLQETFHVTRPVRMDTLTTREYVCQIHAIQHIELRALESGYLEKIYVDEGQYIQEGQLMFQILPIQYKAELQKAEAEANYVRIEYENARILTDSNVISPTQLALVRAKYEKAQAELELARVKMRFTEIRAPFSGLMDRFHVRQGSLLDEGELLTTLSDISSLWVYFNVPEAEYINYKRSVSKDSFMKVQLRMANGEVYDHIGEVKTIEADFNNETGNIAFRATFPNPNELLRHGETGNVIVQSPMQNAMIIPQKATFEVLDKKYVYVVDREHKVKSRKIAIKAEMPDLYILEGGLETSDMILLEGLRKVRENDEIQYEFKEPKKVISELKLHAE